MTSPNLAQPSVDDRKLGMLDGLRGLMALWVLLGHACILTGIHIPVLGNPAGAVEGFMILSGFLMTYHYILRAPKEPWGALSTWTAFWTRRYFRITPLYALVLVPTFLLMPHYVFWRSQIDRFNGSDLRFAALPQLDWQNLVLHATYVFGLMPKYCSSLVIPDWSLSLEMQFYFFFPFLMLLAARAGWAWFAALCAGVWAAAHLLGLGHSFMQPSPLYLSLVWFVIGMLWASHYRDPEKRNRFVWAGCALALLSLKPISIALACLFALVIFVKGAPIDKIRGYLSGPVSKFLADASYSVYLIHLLFLTPIVFYLNAHTALPRAEKLLLSVAVTAIVSYALAKPLEVIEVLGHDFGKRLAKFQLARR